MVDDGGAEGVEVVGVGDWVGLGTSCVGVGEGVFATNAVGVGEETPQVGSLVGVSWEASVSVFPHAAEPRPTPITSSTASTAARA